MAGCGSQALVKLSNWPTHRGGEPWSTSPQGGSPTAAGPVNHREARRGAVDAVPALWESPTRVTGSAGAGSRSGKSGFVPPIRLPIQAAPVGSEWAGITLRDDVATPGTSMGPPDRTALPVP